MKNYIKYILSIFLIITLMVSSFGLTIYNHYCGHTGKIIISLYNSSNCECEKNSNSCHTDTDITCCSDKNKNHLAKIDKSINKLNCCQDNELKIEINDNFLSKVIHYTSDKINITKFINESLTFHKLINTSIENKLKQIKKKFKYYQNIIIKVHSILIFPKKDNSPKDNAV